MSLFPPMPPLNEPRIVYYPVIYAHGRAPIHGISYVKNHQTILADRNDELFILINNEFQPLGKIKYITIRSKTDSIIDTYKLDENSNIRYRFTEKYPQYSTTPINKLELYVGISKTTGGRKGGKGRKSRKGGKGRKSRKSRKSIRK